MGGWSILDGEKQRAKPHERNETAPIATIVGGVIFRLEETRSRHHHDSTKEGHS